MNDAILVINAGSTSVKFALFPAGAGDRLCQGSVSGMLDHPVFAVKAGTAELGRHDWGAGRDLDHAAALAFVLDWIGGQMRGHRIIAAGHRVVLGADAFTGPVRITPEVLTRLDALCAMEPSHQAFNLRGARAVAAAHPGMPQVACFDSAFHRNMPEVAQTYALPLVVRQAGVRRWGYHGLSYDYLSRQMPKLAPKARRVVAAHLGGGASLCALLDGASIDCSMGFDAISGVTMATRPGDVPAGALFYLLRQGLYDVTGLEAMLYDQSGLLGLSGISDDMRMLLDSPDPRAAAAVAQFCYSVAKQVGGFAVALGGLDALVFTAGIGENAAPVRAAICAHLAGMGVVLDVAANARGLSCISTPDSAVSVWVIPTDEEAMIAEQTRAVIAG